MEREGGVVYGCKNRRYKLLGIRQAQGCNVQYGEYDQYSVITVNGKHPLKIVLKIKKQTPQIPHSLEKIYAPLC